MFDLEEYHDCIGLCFECMSNSDTSFDRDLLDRLNRQAKEQADECQCDECSNNKE